MPILLVTLLVAAGTFGFGYLVAAYFGKRANLQPSYKGLLVGALAGASLIALFLVLKQFGIHLFRGTARVIFDAVLVFVFLSIPARIMLSRLRSGSELADLGPSPLRTVFLIGAALLLVASVGGLLARSFSFGQAAVSLAQGVALATLGLTHSQIRTLGIYNGGGLLLWKRIANYEWTNGHVLLIDLHQPRWWHDRVQLPVPPVLVEQVDRLMLQHVLNKQSR